MRRLWIVGLVLLLTLLTGSAHALDTVPQVFSGDRPIEQGESTAADVRVIPSSGFPGSTHTIIITGLQVGEEITVRIRQDASGEEVYNTTRTADDTARVQFDVFTTLRDTPGTYTVEAVSRSGNVLGSATLTITELPGRDGSVLVEPQQAEAGANITFSISGVRPFADLEILIRTEAGQQVASIRVRADVDGIATTSYASDPALSGTFVVAVRDGRDEVASASLTIVEKVYAVDTAIEPQQPNPLDEVFVTLSGLEAGAAVVAQVLYNEAPIASYDLIGDPNGLAIFSFVLERDVTLGDYEIRVLSGEEVISQLAYQVQLPDIALEVTPTEGLPGSRFVANLSGMLPDEAVTVELYKDGAALVTVNLTSAADGTARAILGQRMTLEPGDYTVRVLRGETVANSTPVAIVTERGAQEVAAIDPALVRVSVSPLSAPVPAEYTLRVEGVPPATALSLSIIYDGRSVLTVRGEADASGIYETVVTSEETDPPGTYTLEVRAEGELIGSVDFEIAEAGSPVVTPEATEPAADSAMLEINPSTVARGEAFAIVISRLNPAEVVKIDVLFENASVYSTERTAGDDGVVTLDLQSEDSDTPGMYGIVVVRADGSTLQGAFTITEQVAQATPAPTEEVSGEYAVTITPAQGDPGTEFALEATGFDTGARVDIEVRLNGEVVFTDRRNADVNGVLRARIQSAADAAAGTYEVVLLRGEQVIATSSYVIGDGGAVVPPAQPTATPIPTQEPAPAQVSVTVEPASGAAGTNHTITVTGLAAGSDVSFDVQYGGSSVYQTARTAAADGSASLILVTEATDPAGVYTVVVSDSSGAVLGSVDFTLEAQTVAPTSTPTPTQQPAPAQVSISVEPLSGAVGTTHTVTITGLVAGSEVLFDVQYGGSSVYRTSRIAASDGSAVLPLVTEEGDPAGIYTVVVSDSSGALLGSVQFTLEAATTAPTPVPTEAAQPTNVTITISPESGVAGTSHVVTVAGLSEGTEALFDVRYAGNTVYRTSRVADASGLVSITLVTDSSDQPGVYEVIVSTTVGVLGSAQFTLQENAIAPTPEPTVEPTPAPTRQPSAGDGAVVISERLSAENPEFRYSFYGTQGETLLISVSTSDLDSYVRLLDSGGNELAYNDDSGDTLNSQIGPFVLPYTGSFTVVVTSYPYFSYGEVTVGDFELIVERVALGQIGYGETLQIELNPQMFSQFLRFSGTAGDVISLTVSSGGSVDTVLSILDPSGTQVFSDDDSGEGFDPEVMRYVLPVSGDYTVALRTYNTGDTGTVSLSLIRSDSRTLDTETRTVRLNPKQTQDILTLQGSAGQTIGLTIRLMAGDVGNLSITVEQAGVQLMSYSTSGMPAAITLGFEVPQDGNVTIRIEDISTSGSTYEFQISR